MMKEKTASEVKLEQIINRMNEDQLVAAKDRFVEEAISYMKKKDLRYYYDFTPCDFLQLYCDKLEKPGFRQSIVIGRTSLEDEVRLACLLVGKYVNETLYENIPYVILAVGAWVYGQHPLAVKIFEEINIGK